MKFGRLLIGLFALPRNNPLSANPEVSAAMESLGFVRSHRRLVTRLAIGSLLSGTLVIAQAQVSEDWVRRYDNGAQDSATDLAVDVAGNVHVTGYSFADEFSPSDYATVKYDAAGNELWVRRYDNGSSDQALAVAVDGAGNVYVTGTSLDLLTGSQGVDYATIKYDADGDECWVRRYNYAVDYGEALALDDAGNVYVTGRSGDRIDDTTYDWDYATVKYDGEGNELWARRYDHGNDDSARALAADSAGNIYVMGWSHDPTSGDDYATVKYDAEGNEVWVRRYDSGGEDLPFAMAVDDAGNTYVTGFSRDGTLDEEYATVKYDTHGNQQWVRRYNYGSYEIASAVAVDDAGNVYVTGRSGEYTAFDFATIKYDAEGNELWVRRYDSGRDDGAEALALDAAGNVYVSGSSSDASIEFDYVTVKYDAQGDELWVSTYDHGLFDMVIAMGLDGAGNVYVTGDSYDPTTWIDYTTIKYVQTLTPAEQMANALAFYEQALEAGTISGLGRDHAATAHEEIFGLMLAEIYDLILGEDYDKACSKLTQALLRIDGDEPPPDLVGGVAAASLHEMLLDIYSSLGG